MAILADQIRSHVIKNMIQPARTRGQTTILLLSGDIHAEMGLINRLPAVCSALDAAKFQEQAAVMLIEREGPHQGASVKWHFSLK